MAKYPWNEHTKTFKKTGLWFLFNFGFGLAPLIWVGFFSLFLHDNYCGAEVSHLLNGGLVFFVIIAIMGSVTIDYINSGIKFSGLAYFALSVLPFVLLFIVLVMYLCVLWKKLPEDYFGSSSGFFYFVTVIAGAYSFVGKYLLFLNEK